MIVKAYSVTANTSIAGHDIATMIYRLQAPLPLSLLPLPIGGLALR